MNGVPDAHRLTEYHEKATDYEHFIFVDGSGYIGDEEVIGYLQAQHNSCLLQEKKYDDGEKAYIGTNMTSLRGFLNSTKLDSRSQEKRSAVMSRIRQTFDSLSAQSIGVSRKGQFSYLDVAVTDELVPKLLPNDIEVQTYETVEEASHVNRISRTQIVFSIFSKLGDADKTPFEVLIDKSQEG